MVQRGTIKITHQAAIAGVNLCDYRQVQRQRACDRLRVAQILGLVGTGATGDKVAVLHPLAILAQDDAVGKAALQRIPHHCAIGPGYRQEKRRLGHQADGARHDHLVGKPCHLPRAGGTNPDRAAQGGKDRQGTLERRVVATRHDGERSTLGPAC